MKKILFIVALLAVTLMASAQNSWSGFLYPVKSNPKIVQHEQLYKMKSATAQDSSYNIVLWRGTAGVEGTLGLYNKTTKVVEAGTFSKAGFGISYCFYHVTKGIPYNYLSLNLLAFAPVTGSNNPIDKAFDFVFSASLYDFHGISPQVGITFSPGLINSDYFPVGLMWGLKYTF